MVFQRWIKRFLALSFYSKLKWFLFLLIILWAAVRRFSLPLAPFADHDIRGYLNPVINAYRFHFLGHSNCRSFPYPLFVWVVTRLADSLYGITVVQHVLGLLTDILIFSIWQQPFMKSYANVKLRWIATILQLISTGYFLLVTGIIFFEHSIRPESAAIFLIVLLLFLLIRNLSRPDIWLLSASLFLTLFLSVFFPRWGFALPVTLVYAVGAVIRLPVSAGRKALAVTAPVMLFLVLVWMPERLAINKYDPATGNFMARQFFYSHADIAQKLMAQGNVNRPQQLSHTAMKRIADALVTRPSADAHFKQLGFNPDELMYGPVATTVDSILRSEKMKDFAFYRFYDLSIVTAGFGKYMNRVFNELLAYYGYNTGFERIYLYEQPVYDNTYAITQASLYPDMDDAAPLFKLYRTEVKSMGNYTAYSSFTAINVLYFLLQLTFLPTLIIFAFVFAALYFTPGRVDFDEIDGFNQLGKACWLLLAVHFSLVLTVAAIHSFGIERYGASVFAVAILTQLFCLFYLAVAGFVTICQRTEY